MPSVNTRAIQLGCYSASTAPRPPPDIDTLTLSSPIPDQSAQAGTAFRYSFPSSTFVGPRGSTITYFARESSGATLPYWLNFVPGTRTFWGTPRAQDVGTLSVKVTASDGNRSVIDTFDIAVAPIARTTAPLVSNLHQGWRVGLRAGGIRQRFTTGPNATSYTLSSVEVGRWDRPHSGSVTDDANTRLQVCPVAPTTGSCKSLTSPATTRHGADTMLFTASSGITLFPSATYDVVLTPAAGSTLWVGATYIGDDDADSDAGWAIHQDASASTPRVRIAVYGSANGASAGPTSADKTVSTATETAYVFSAADFPFTANTSGDTMASVVVATRTANDTSYDKGRLRLDGNDFETPFTLTKADLDAGRLVYTPWTDVRGGRRYARSPYEESFRFWVNGGTRATATHRMTIDVSTSSLATVAPSVTGVEIEPEANNASWEEGEAVEATLTFDEAVTVDTTGGVPAVSLTLGASTEKSAAYVRGSGTTELVFGYTLAKGEGPYDSVLLTLNSLALNGGAIRSTASGADAALAHDGFAVIGGPTSRGVAEPGPTARFSALPERHDGESAFDIELHFSAAPEGLSYRTVGGGLLAVTGATVEKARRKTRHSNTGWVVTIRPSGPGDIAIRLPARACGEANAVCFDNRPLARDATAAVPGLPPFTASFAGAPAEHDGDTAFTVNFHLSLAPATLSSYRTVRDSLFDVTGARIVKARRLTPRKNQNWELTVAPGGLADVTLRLKATTSCSALPGVCDAAGRMLAGGLSTTVRGPVTLSVADAQGEEGTDETIGFAVSLSRAASGTVTVDYATADGTATAGEDYSSTSGTLTFAAGETAKTVSVPVLDDVVDEGQETFTLRLSNATGARIADAEATGTVSNGDPLQKMWLSRFGRTVADHVVDAVAGRLSAPLAGAQITLAGQRVDLSRTGDSAVLVDAMTGLARAFGAPGGAAASGVTAPGAWPDRHGGAWDSPAASGGSPVRSVTGRELLLGSSFHLALDGEGGGGTGLTAWGRATVGGFDGQGDAETGAMRMDGEVITGILGADVQRGRWLAGLALSVSEGEGTFEQPEAGHRGTIESNMTSVNPYLRFEASERLSTWGLLGFGTGEMTITEAARGERGETVTRTGIEMRLAAVGARGALLDAATSGGFDLAVKADAFLVETEWEKVSNERDTQAGASRLRLVLEGSRAFELSESAKLTLGLEFGLRHDGGDAETGTGVEVGGSVRYADAASGLSVEARGRTLIAHEASGFEEWGASASVRLDPGAEGRGLSFSLAPTLGAASSGVDRLWSLQDARGLAPEGKFVAARSLEAQIGYGFGAFGDHGLAKPYAGLSLGEGGARTWRGGVRWTLGQSLDLGLEVSRAEAANDNDPDHGIGFRLTARW